MNISIFDNDIYKVIRLEGSADMTATNDLNAKVKQLISENNFNLIFDLSELGFICSMGLGCLIFAHSRCLENEGQFSIVNPQPAVVKLLQTTQLDHLFNIFPSIEAATS